MNEKGEDEILPVITKQTFDSGTLKKISGVSSGVKKYADTSRNKMSPSVANSSQAYKKYLEEMELKIRYIKNDIEFKQEQMKARKMSDVSVIEKGNNSCQTINNNVDKRDRIVVDSLGNNKIVSSPQFSGCNPSKAPFQTIPHEILPQEMNQKSQSYVSPFGIQLVLKKSAVCSQLLQSEKIKPDSKVLYFNEVGSKSTMSISSRIVIAPKSSLTSTPKSLSSPLTPHCSSLKKRIVALPLNRCHQNQAHQKLIVHKEKVKNHSMTSSRMPKTSKPLFDSQMKMSPSKYKYVASCVDGINDSSTAKSSLTSNKLLSQVPFIPKTTQVSAVRPFIQHSVVSNEGKHVKKITPLNIKRAAKLVSKYKLRRLSPTLPSKRAMFSTSRSVSHTSLRKLQRSSSYEQSKQMKTNNIFKLDKRKSSEDTGIITPNLLQTSPGYYKTWINESSKIKDIAFERTSHCKLNANHQSHPVFNVYKKNQNSLSTLPMAERHIGNLQDWNNKDVIMRTMKQRSGAKKHPSQTQASGVTAIFNKSKFKWSNALAGKLHRHKQLIVAKRPYGRIPLGSQLHQRRDKLIMIRGVAYRSSKSSLKRAVLTRKKIFFNQSERSLRMSVPAGRGSKHLNVKLFYLRGIRFHSDASGKKLCRLNTSVKEKEAFHKTPNIESPSLKPSKVFFETSKDIQKVAAASRAVQRSLAFVAAKNKKDSRQKKEKRRHCIFFCRFGKCHRGNACPYVHDQDKVVVCTRFLRGKCDAANCHFSHDASVHKMPVCLYYLQGLCSRQDCLYLHVNVSMDAPPCKDFLQGYCASGDKCKNLHSLLCPSFAVSGKCSKRNTCSLLHRFKRSQPSCTANTRSELRHPVPSPALRLNEKCVQVAAHSESHSLTGIEEHDSSISVGSISSPLKSQPTFISLTVDNTRHLYQSSGSSRDKQFSHMTEIKPKIKPQLSLSKNKIYGCHISHAIMPNAQTDIITANNIEVSVKMNGRHEKASNFIYAKTVKSETQSELSRPGNKNLDIKEMSGGSLETFNDKTTQAILQEPDTALIELSSSCVDINDTSNISPEKNSSGFIDFPSSIDQTVVGDGLSDLGGGKFINSSSSLISHNILQNQLLDKTTVSSSSKTTLLKGIIPNFIPLFGDDRSNPESQ